MSEVKRKDANLNEDISEVVREDVGYRDAPTAYNNVCTMMMILMLRYINYSMLLSNSSRLSGFLVNFSLKTKF